RQQDRTRRTPAVRVRPAARGRGLGHRRRAVALRTRERTPGMQYTNASIRPAGPAHAAGRARRSRLPVVVLAGMAVLAAACGSTTMTSVGPTPVRCDVTVTPPAAVPAAGGVSTIAISTEAECAWSVASTAPWISQVQPQSGLGEAQVRFTVAPNAGPPRSATLTVEDKTVTVTQVSGCSYTIERSTHAADAS